MNTLAQVPMKKQNPEELVNAGIKDGIRHEVIKDIGRGEYLTRCGERVVFGNLILTRRPASEINCPNCKLENDADFKARKQAGRN